MRKILLYTKKKQKLTLIWKLSIHKTHKQLFNSSTDWIYDFQQQNKQLNPQTKLRDSLQSITESLNLSHESKNNFFSL
jgi:hypothetical protein